MSGGAGGQESLRGVITIFRWEASLRINPPFNALRHSGNNERRRNELGFNLSVRFVVRKVD